MHFSFVIILNLGRVGVAIVTFNGGQKKDRFLNYYKCRRHVTTGQFYLVSELFFLVNESFLVNFYRKN